MTTPPRTVAGQRGKQQRKPAHQRSEAQEQTNQGTDWPRNSERRRRSRARPKRAD
jgi:hypothetical protein